MKLPVRGWPATDLGLDLEREGGGVFGDDDGEADEPGSRTLKVSA